jgi:hypothetical protein
MLSTLYFFLCVFTVDFIWATTGTRSIRYHHESTLVFQLSLLLAGLLLSSKFACTYRQMTMLYFVVHQASMS